VYVISQSFFHAPRLIRLKHPFTSRTMPSFIGPRRSIITQRSPRPYPEACWWSLWQRPSFEAPRRLTSRTLQVRTAIGASFRISCLDRNAHHADFWLTSRQNTFLARNRGTNQLLLIAHSTCVYTYINDSSATNQQTLHFAHAVYPVS
jgi:hypothetical protein